MASAPSRPASADVASRRTSLSGVAKKLSMGIVRAPAAPMIVTVAPSAPAEVVVKGRVIGGVTVVAAMGLLAVGYFAPRTIPGRSYYNIKAQFEDADNLTNSYQVRIGGRLVNSVPPKDRDIAMVFQSYALYPTMTVRENITFGMESRGVAKAEQAEKELARQGRQAERETFMRRVVAKCRRPVGGRTLRPPVEFVANVNVKRLRLAHRLDRQFVAENRGKGLVLLDRLDALAVQHVEPHHIDLHRFAERIFMQQAAADFERVLVVAVALRREDQEAPVIRVLYVMVDRPKAPSVACPGAAARHR